jgi:hypothetical protein
MWCTLRLKILQNGEMGILYIPAGVFYLYFCQLKKIRRKGTRHTYSDCWSWSWCTFNWTEFWQFLGPRSCIRIVWFTLPSASKPRKPEVNQGTRTLTKNSPYVRQEWTWELIHLPSPVKFICIGTDRDWLYNPGRPRNFLFKINY